MVPPLNSQMQKLQKSQRLKRGHTFSKQDKFNKATRLDDYLRPATARAFISRSAASDTEDSMSKGSSFCHSNHPIDSEDETDEMCDIDRNGCRLQLTQEGAQELENRLKDLRKEIAESKNMKGVAHVISADGIKQLVRMVTGSKTCYNNQII